MKLTTGPGLLLAVAIAIGFNANVSAAVPNPTVTPPVTGGSRGQPFAALPAAAVPSGYLEEERFFSGTATAYTKSGTWGVDGKWEVKPGTTAPYNVRMLIRRPKDAARFNGVLIVEWLNVTAQLEGAADYAQMQEALVRDGYAWVGVGAQAVGVNAPGTGLKAWDPTRYAALVHPGDAYAYDIYSQAAQALRHPVGENPLGRASHPSHAGDWTISIGVPARHLSERVSSVDASLRRVLRAQSR